MCTECLLTPWNKSECGEANRNIANVQNTSELAAISAVDINYVSLASPVAARPQAMYTNTGTES